MSESKNLIWMLMNKVDELNTRLQVLEGHLGIETSGTFPRDVSPSEGQSGDEVKPESEGDVEGSGFSEADLVKATWSISLARRSVYNYAALLNEMGLSKDQKKMVKEMEEIMTVFTRAIQAVRLFQLAGMALEAADPWMMPFLIMGGGAFAASIAYGSKLSSGV